MDQFSDIKNTRVGCAWKDRTLWLSVQGIGLDGRLGLGSGESEFCTSMLRIQSVQLPNQLLHNIPLCCVTVFDLSLCMRERSLKILYSRLHTHTSGSRYSIYFHIYERDSKIRYLLRYMHRRGSKVFNLLFYMRERFNGIQSYFKMSIGEIQRCSVYHCVHR